MGLAEISRIGRFHTLKASRIEWEAGRVKITVRILYYDQLEVSMASAGDHGGGDGHSDFTLPV